MLDKSNLVWSTANGEQRGWAGMETTGDEFREKMEVQITWGVKDYCKVFGPQGAKLQGLEQRHYVIVFMFWFSPL